LLFLWRKRAFKQVREEYRDYRNNVRNFSAERSESILEKALWSGQAFLYNSVLISFTQKYKISASNNFGGKDIWRVFSGKLKSLL
jgi:hypothetical protein